MKKRIMATLLAFILSVSMLAGCGKDTGKEASAKAEEGVAAEAVEANSEEMEFDESKANDVDYVMNYYQKVLDNSSRKGSSYALIYMDEDDIPELITDKGLFLSKDYEDEIDGSSVPIYYLPYGNRILEDESEGHSDYDVYHVFRRLDYVEPFGTGDYHMSMGFSFLAGNSNDITWNNESITNAQMMQLMDELRIDDMIQLTYSFDSSTPVSEAYESLLENPNGVANEVGEEEQQVMELDVSELDSAVDRYDSYRYFSSYEPQGQIYYRFENITTNDWQHPDLVVVGDAGIMAGGGKLLCVARYENSERIYDTFAVEDTLYRAKDYSKVHASDFEIYRSFDPNKLCFHLSKYYSDTFGTLEYWHFWKMGGGSGSGETKYLSRTLEVNYGTNTGRVVLHNPFVESYENTEDYYKRACDVQLKDYSLLFSGSEMYSSIDAAYNAYIDSYVDEFLPNIEVKIVHKDDLGADLEGVDNSALEKYRDYLNANNMNYIVDDGCKFVDIDGDGTPEMIADFGAQFQSLLYVGSDGEVHEIYCLEAYNTNIGGLVLTDDSGLSTYFYILADGNIENRFNISVSWDWDENTYYYYYSKGDEGYEITPEEASRIWEENNYSGYTFVQCSDAPAEKTLEDAWRVYSVNIIDTVSTGGNDDIFQKYLNSVAADDISDDDGCCFVDIDGDGTPELIKHLGSRLPFLYYIDQNGNIDDAEITGLIEGSGKCVSEWSMGTGEESGIDFYTIREGMITKDCSVSRVYTEAGMGPVIYSYEHDGISEDITDTQYEEFADRVKNYKLGDSYSSLSAAWEAYKH